MSAVVVVLKPFSPFTKLDHEIDLNKLPPPPSLDDFSPEFHGAPLLHPAACTPPLLAWLHCSCVEQQS